MKTLTYLLYAVGGYIGVVLGIHYVSFVFLCVLMLFDTVVGIAKSIRLGEFTSHNMIRGLVAKIFILCLMMIFGALSNHLYPELQFDNQVVGMIIGLLSIAELISSIQNIIMIRKGEHIEEWDAVSYVLSNVLGFFKSKLENMKF